MTTRYSTTEWNNKKVILGKTKIDEKKPVNLLVGFHGAGSTPENILVLGNRLTLQNTLMVFPEGPVNAGDGIWSWWEEAAASLLWIFRCSTGAEIPRQSGAHECEPAPGEGIYNCQNGCRQEFRNLLQTR